MTEYIDEHGCERSCCPNPEMHQERWKDLNYGSRYTVTIYILFCENCGFVDHIWSNK